MNSRFIRDSFWGRTVYHLSGHKYFNHREEQPEYEVPAKYLAGGEKNEFTVTQEAQDSSLSSNSSSSTIIANSNIKDEDSLIVVDWDGPDDPENPYNWPLLSKVIFASEIAFLTLSVYMGSAIYTPGIEYLTEDLGISKVKATLPLTMFVIGYGLGPMVFSPMSENAIFGRTSIYIITLFLFFILQIPQSFGVGTHSIASLSVLRFLSGTFASPALATGVASFGDVVTTPYMPVGIASWSISAVCGPSMGPLIGAVLVNGSHGDWVWPFRFMMIISGVCFLVLGFLLPESYGKTLLRRKAQRLRALTGNDSIMSEGEIENKNMTARELAIDTLWRPFEIALTEPVVLSIDLYISLVYSIMYLWFEAFPIVFVETYGFTLVELGVSYVSVMIGVLVGAVFYISVIYQTFTKKFLNGKGDTITPEVFLPVAIVGSLLMPIGIFIFGWSANPQHHWMGPIMGAAVFCTGAFFVFQTLFNYMAMSFPRYMASVFAGNDLFRSVIAGCFPLFGSALFNNLAIKKFPVAWGSSVLGFISLGMVAIPVTFALLGPKIRARSKYSGE
ncbi:Multidrug resistance protein 1 [Meyerozyma sp. JA9]|nr:Multidrug resistance protein 1 [Meyerozyma sp. JA9]